MNVLVVDVGGTHVKILATGQEQSREFPSGPKLTAKEMVTGVKKLARIGGITTPTLLSEDFGFGRKPRLERKGVENA